jgi:hypothetical protein
MFPLHAPPQRRVLTRSGPFFFKAVSAPQGGQEPCNTPVTRREHTEGYQTVQINRIRGTEKT